MDFDFFLLDVDGVLTNNLAEVSEPVCSEVSRLTREGAVVCLATGRSLDWLYKRVKPFLSKSDYSKLFFVGENGAVWCSFNSSFEPLEGREPEFNVPEKIKRASREKTREWPLLFFDESKTAMVSVESRHELLKSDEDFSASQEQLGACHEYLKGFENDFLRATRTLYACDLHHSGANKETAAKRAFSLAETRPKKILLVGDSEADLRFAEGLPQESGFCFYFVGEEERLRARPEWVLFTKNKHDEGTLSLLKTLNL